MSKTDMGSLQEPHLPTPGSVSSLSLSSPVRLSLVLVRAAAFATGQLLKAVGLRARVGPAYVSYCDTFQRIVRPKRSEESPFPFLVSLVSFIFITDKSFLLSAVSLMKKNKIKKLATILYHQKKSHF